ncbi:MAG: DNA primase [Firmicutes bacterium]|nr:DNA primase [Bacillota bacterium]
MRFSQEFIERVRDGSDIVKIIGEYVRLKRRGRNLVGLCPFHNERTPSFTVSPETQLYHCFGCGAGGNVFSFIMDIENLSFPEAVGLLAEKAGIPIEEQEYSPLDRRKAERERRLLAITSLAAKYFAHLLKTAPEAQKAREYLKLRGINKEAVEAFSLGYANPDWDDLLNVLLKRGYTHQEILGAGLILPKRGGSGYYDRFRDRLIFPIKDQRGKVIAFGGRVLEKDDTAPKYLNSPETEIFTKGAHLYGLDQAKKALRRGEPALIVEGYMDVIALHSHGFTSALASLGTSLTEGQVRLLSRFTSKALIAYDGDTAGETATWRGLEILNKYGLEVKVVVLPEGEDPDSLIRREGKHVFQQAVQNAVPLLDYKIDRSLAGFDLREVNERVKAARAVLPILTGINSAVAREAYLELVARKIGISTGALVRELQQYEKRLRKEKKRNILPGIRNNITGQGHNSAPRVRPTPRSPVEMAALKLLLQNREFAREFPREGLKYFTDRQVLEIARTVLEVATSGQEITPAQMLDRFEDPEVKKIFSQLNFSEELQWSIENVHDCMAKLRTHYFQEELKDLIQKLVNIRNIGQVTDINRLLVKYIHLYKDVQSASERGER